MGKTYKYVNVGQTIGAVGSLVLGGMYLRWLMKSSEEFMTDEEKEAKEAAKKESLVYNLKKALIVKLGGEVSD